MSGPLAGLRIVEVGDFICGPYAGKLMADLGAEVIKVEDPASPDSARDYGPFPNDVPDAESSGLYAYLNANKLGITLDLHTATGRDLFRELIADADAVLDADPARPLRQLGLGYSELRRVNQQLVHTCVTPFGLTGRQAESALRECSITLNRNSLPFDKNGPWYTSGLRLGTPALTTLNMGPEEMKEIASILMEVLANMKPAMIADGQNAGQQSKAWYILDEHVKETCRSRVRELLDRFPVYPELDLDLLKRHFIQP